MNGAGVVLLLFLGFLVAIVVAVGMGFYSAFAEAYPYLAFVIVALFGIVALGLIALYALSHHHSN